MAGEGVQQGGGRLGHALEVLRPQLLILLLGAGPRQLHLAALVLGGGHGLDSSLGQEQFAVRWKRILQVIDPLQVVSHVVLGVRHDDDWGLGQSDSLYRE